MWRAVAGVVVGYLVIVIVVMVTFTGLFLAIGPDGAFRPGSWEPSLLWIAPSVVFSILAAIAAGFVCVKISKGGKAPLVLAGLVLVLGLADGVMRATAERPDPGPRGDRVTNFEAAQNARQPVWVSLLNPLIGAAGVIAGARLRRSDD